MQISLQQGRRKGHQGHLYPRHEQYKSQDKAINLMNEEGKELTVEFLMQQLETKDCNAHHKSLSQLDSSISINFAADDHQQNKGKNSKKSRGNGKDWGQNKAEAQGSSNSSHQSINLQGWRTSA